MTKITLSINGNSITCPARSSILEAAEQHGIKIPRLCYHFALKPFGACRLCLVEDEKTDRLMASCVTPAVQGMNIRTESPRIEKHRRNIVRLMLAEHPESCVVCSKGNRCQLRQIAAQLGIGDTGLYPMVNYKTLEQANPFIVRDLSKCILCGKCIRADHELVVVGAIDYNQRGFKSRPATAHDLGLEDSECTFCGTCVSICPTGALAAENTCYVGTPEREFHTFCGFCGVGCSLAMGVVDNRIVEVNPSHLQNTVNGATLCVRGHFGHDFLKASERLIHPLIRKNGEMVPTSWDEALSVTADRLVEIKQKNGPQSIAFFGSSKCTNEENYLFQKIARVILETNNVDNGGYSFGRHILGQIDERTGGGYRIHPLAGLEQADAVLVLGADPDQSAPVVSYYLKRAAAKGTPLIVADPRQTGLVGHASIWLRVAPCSDLELVNGLAALLYLKKAHDRNFIDRFTKEFSSYRDSLSSLNLEKICRVTAINMETLEKTADLLKRKKIATLVGHGILQQRYGIQSMDALLNLLLMTGSFGNEHSGLYILAKENNQVGAWDMGAVPDGLPGRRLLHDDSARKQWERTWRTSISPDQGLNIVRMIEEAEKSNLKALYIMGENPLRSLPQPGRVRNALKNLDFIVVQDILANETTEISDVVFPGTPFSEKSGSFTNMEGRIQSFEPVVSPPGEAKPDWEILALLAAKMGYSILYNSVEKVKSEIGRLVPMYAGLDGDNPVCWIADEQAGRIPFTPLTSKEDEHPDELYPFTAIIGSLRYQLGSGTRTGYSDRISGFGLKGEIQVSREDGAKLALHDGDIARVSSQYGFLEREIRLEEGLEPGRIFVPTAFNSNDAMNLTGLSPLGESESDGWKTCQVRLEKSSG